MTSKFAAILLSALFASATLAADSPAAGKTIEAELGKEFRLKKGEVAHFDDGRAYMKIVKFINTPCPYTVRLKC